MAAHCLRALPFVLMLALVLRGDAQVILDMPPPPAAPDGPATARTNEAIDVDDPDREPMTEEAEYRVAETFQQYRNHQVAVGRLALQRYIGARSIPQRSWHPAAHVAAYQRQFVMFGRSPGFFTPHGLSPQFPQPFVWYGDAFRHWHGPWYDPWHWHWHPDWWFVSGGFFAPRFVVIPPRHGITVRFKIRR